MKKKGQITYEISEEEYSEMKNHAEEVRDFFLGYTDYTDAKHSIERIITILENSDDDDRF